MASKKRASATRPSRSSAAMRNLASLLDAAIERNRRLDPPGPPRGSRPPLRIDEMVPYALELLPGAMNHNITMRRDFESEIAALFMDGHSKFGQRVVRAQGADDAHMDAELAACRENNVPWLPMMVGEVGNIRSMLKYDLDRIPPELVQLFETWSRSPAPNDRVRVAFATDGAIAGTECVIERELGFVRAVRLPADSPLHAPNTARGAGAANRVQEPDLAAPTDDPRADMRRIYRELERLGFCDFEPVDPLPPKEVPRESLARMMREPGAISLDDMLALTLPRLASMANERTHKGPIENTVFGCFNLHSREGVLAFRMLHDWPDQALRLRIAYGHAFARAAGAPWTTGIMAEATDAQYMSTLLSFVEPARREEVGAWCRRRAPRHHTHVVLFNGQGSATHLVEVVQSSSGVVESARLAPPSTR